MILGIPPPPIPEVKIDQLQLIVDQIINLLRLNENEKKDEILNDLFQYGQRSLETYKDYLIADVYTSVLNDDENELIKNLKKYFEEQWNRQYQSSNSLLIRLLNEVKSNDYHDIYEQVLTRTAKHGKKYVKNCTILALSLQVFFEGITDQCLEDTTIFDELWYAITTDGIQSIQKYSDYITADLMNKQINNKQSMLFQSLHEYYRQELIPLFQQCDIKDRQNLYQLAPECLAESGWNIGLQAVSSRILSAAFKNLSEKVNLYLKEQSNLI